MRTYLLLILSLILISVAAAEPPPDPIQAFRLERKVLGRVISSEQVELRVAPDVPPVSVPADRRDEPVAIPHNDRLPPPPLALSAESKTPAYNEVQPSTPAYKEPVWSEIPQLRKPKNESPYEDVASHFPQHHTMRWREYEAVDTTTHEMTHAINAIVGFQVNMLTKNKTFDDAHSVFYVGGGRCYTLGAPKTKHGDLKTWLPMPPQLAQPYGIYIRKAGRARSLEMVDEWTAYMQDVRQSTYMTTHPNETAGQRLGPNLGQLPAFAYFVTALAAQIERDDPEFAADERWQVFFRWCHLESARLYLEGRKYPLIRPKDERRQGLVDSPEAAGVRHWLKTRYDLDVAELYPRPE